MRKATKEEGIIRTSINNQRAELINLQCEECGAPLQITDRTHAKCSFCGRTYLIDEARGMEVEVNVDYGDSGSALRIIKILLIVFFVIAVMIAAAVATFNIMAVDSQFFSSDANRAFEHDGYLLPIFCEDIFGKDYWKITEEEFATVKYIRYDYKREGQTNNWHHYIYYSFTDYEDCADEQEFLDTVHTWTYEDSKAMWPDDYSMFTGLTRIYTVDTIGIQNMKLSKKCRITYVETENQLGLVAKAVNPQYVKILCIHGQSENMAGLEKFEQLEELTLCGNRYGVVDLTGIGGLKNLRSLKLEDAEGYEGLGELKELPNLTELFIDHINLDDCTFLKEMPQLEELSVYTGDEPRLTILADLPNLRRLTFLDGCVISVSKLAPLSKLEAVKIRIDSQEDLQALAQFSNLQELELTLKTGLSAYRDGERMNLSVLTDLGQLKRLIVQGDMFCEVKGVTEILNKPGLKEFGLIFSIGETVALDIVPDELSICESVEGLYFENCRFPEKMGETLLPEILEKFPNLKNLGLPNAGISDISFLVGNSELRECDLRNNEITDYEPLLGCKKLKKVYTGGNPQTDPKLPVMIEVDAEPDPYPKCFF